MRRDVHGMGSGQILDSWSEDGSAKIAWSFLE